MVAALCLLGGEACTRVLLGFLLGQCSRAADRPHHERYRDDPVEDRAVFQSFGQANQALLIFEIARSDWFKRVLEPIGTVEYLSSEIVLPRGDPSLRAAVARLRDAESAFANHDDPSVFLHCRGALDALPGAKQEIFATLADRSEAKVLDRLTLGVGDYLHRGRHVAEEGEQDGEFPVDHDDARFALNLTKLLVAHISRVLGR